jgi:hypothetical protein
VRICLLLLIRGSCEFLLGHNWTSELPSPVSVINVTSTYSRPPSPPLHCLGKKTLFPSYHIASWYINVGVSNMLP